MSITVSFTHLLGPAIAIVLYLILIFTEGEGVPAGRTSARAFAECVGAAAGSIF